MKFIPALAFVKWINKVQVAKINSGYVVLINHDGGSDADKWTI